MKISPSRPTRSGSEKAGRRTKLTSIGCVPSASSLATATDRRRVPVRRGRIVSLRRVRGLQDASLELGVRLPRQADLAEGVRRAVQAVEEESEAVRHRAREALKE
jgi:hypothetical protein